MIFIIRREKHKKDVIFKEMVKIAAKYGSSCNDILRNNI